MGEWFTESFGEDYKIVYRHRNRASAEREIGSMMEWMELPSNAAVLDIGCGMGRHAHALRELGYEVTGLDLSEVLLSEARRSDHEGHMAWVRGDMRQLPFADNRFDATVNLFTSFGYFEAFDDNRKVLQEIKRVLKPDGRYLIDFLNPTYVIKHLVPQSIRIDKHTGLQITEKRTIENDFVVKKIKITPPVDSSGVIAQDRHYEERVRLISVGQFEEILNDTGLQLDAIYGGYDGSPYLSESSKRLILLGRHVQ
jgi:SAM-dependent methyltransferase